MNPNLQYAQAIHGVTSGRGTGIIDTIHTVEVAQAVPFVRDSDALSKSDSATIHRWLRIILRGSRHRKTVSRSATRTTITQHAGECRWPPSQSSQAIANRWSSFERATRACTFRISRPPTGVFLGSLRDQAIWLFAAQPGGDGGHLPDTFRRQRRSLTVENGGRPRHRKGDCVHVSLDPG